VPLYAMKDVEGDVFWQRRLAIQAGVGEDRDYLSSSIRHLINAVAMGTEPLCWFYHLDRFQHGCGIRLVIAPTSRDWGSWSLFRSQIMYVSHINEYQRPSRHFSLTLPHVNVFHSNRF